MKKQLRNAMLAAATIMAAGSANAQVQMTEGFDAFTITCEWENTDMTAGGLSDARGATGTPAGDAIYVVNKTNDKIYKVTKDATTEFFSGLQGSTAFDITSDDAGNLIFIPGGGGAGLGKVWILPAGKTSADDLVYITYDVTKENGITVDNSRVDRLGRVLGDVMSEDGGLLYYAVNGADAAVAVKIANGAFVEASTGLAGDGLAMNSFWLAVPWATSVEEAEGTGDFATACYLYQANGGKIWGPNDDFNGLITYNAVKSGSGYGFDWFMVGDEVYFIESTKLNNTGGYVNGSFNVVRVSDNGIVATYTAPVDNASGQVWGSVQAWPQADGSIIITNWNGRSGSSIFRVNVAGSEPETHTVAIAGAFNSWSTTANSTTEIVDNCATIEVENWNSNWEFKYIVDGEWYSNANTAVAMDTWYSDATTGGMDNNMKLDAAANGKNVKFTVAVNTKSFKVEITGTPTPEAPETCNVIGQLVAGEWNTTAVGALAKTGDFTFEGNVDMAGGWFSLCEKQGTADDWDSIGKRWGAQSDGYELYSDTPAPICLGSSAFNMQSFLEYPVNVKFVVDFENMTVTVTNGTSGIEGVSVDNAPVEYFSLQGVRVANPANGLYIRRQGNNVSKVLVK